MQKKTNFAFVVEIIQQLLIANNCVIVPGFGAFIGNYQPSVIQLSEHTIFPPSKLIVFNRILQTNDGVLINAVAQKNAVDYQIAEAMVNEFVFQCKKSLTINKSLIVKNIGRFVLDDEDNLQFQPFANQNYLIDSFGLPSMSIQPIARLKDSVSDIVTIEKNNTTTAQLLSRSNKIKKYSFAAVVVGILILTSILLINNNTSKFQNESSIVSVFDSAPAQKSIIIEEEKKTSLPVVTTTENDNTNSTTFTVDNNITTKSNDAVTTALKKINAYIVIGAFFDQARAEKLKAEAIDKGYSVNISKDEKLGLYRTTVETNDKDINADLKQIQADINPRAWVFCVKCNLN